MPLPTPQSKETKGKFISRCISSMIRSGETKNIKQAAAICIKQWEKKEKDKK